MDLRAAEKLCWPSLRSESAAAAFSCSQPDGLHGHGRVLRCRTVFHQPTTVTRLPCFCSAFSASSVFNNSRDSSLGSE